MQIIDFLASHMGLIVISLITIAFLAVIFTSGYNDKPKTD